MGKKQDPESLICETFLEMGKATSVLKIKVKDLCDEACITRNCFYANFDSIYAVLQKIEDDFFAGLAEESSIAYPQKLNKAVLKQSVLSPAMIARYLEKNKKVCRVLWGPNGDMAFQARLLNYIRNGIEKVSTEAGLFESEAEIELAKEFMGNGLLGLVKQRAMNDDDIPVNDWALIVIKLLSKCIS